MNEIIQAMKERRSCRKYQDTMIPKEDLEEIIEAGLYAASGMGKQSPIIVAVTNKEVRDELSKMNAAVMGSENDPFYGAPVVLIVLADKSVRTEVPLMPGSREVFDMARLCGAKAVYVSGAGSTVMAVAEKAEAEKFYSKLEKGLELLEGLDGCEAFTLLQLDADNTGATVE